MASAQKPKKGSKKYKEPPYQYYLLWFAHQLKITLMWGHYMLGANMIPDIFLPEYKSQYNLDPKLLGRNQEVDLKTCDSMLVHEKWEGYSLYDLANIEKLRAKKMPKELYARVSVAMWNDLYERLCKIWLKYAELRRSFIASNTALIGSLLDKSIRYRSTFGANHRSDLFNEANVGTVGAFDKYKFTSGKKISNLMAYWIENRIKETIDTNQSIICTPGHVQALKRNVEQWRQEFLEKHDREPTRQELEAHFTNPKTKLSNVLGVEFNFVCSIDSPMDDDGDTTLADVIPDQRNDFANIGEDIKVTKEAVKKVIEELPESGEKTALTLLFNSACAESVIAEQIKRTAADTKKLARQLLNNSYHILRNNARILSLAKSDVYTPKKLKSDEDPEFPFLQGLLD